MKNLLWIKDVFGDYPLVGDMKENNYWKKLYLDKLIKEGKYPFLINQTKEEIKTTEEWIEEMENAE